MLALEDAHAFAAPPPRPPNETSLLAIDLPQLQYAGKWQPRPEVMRELGLELRLRTRLQTKREPTIVHAESPALFETPFLYIAGSGSFPSFSPREESRLRRFVDLGGMLFFDDADGGSDHTFFEGVRSFLERLLPESKLKEISKEHVLYRSFYIIEDTMGRTRARTHCQGIQEDGRLKVLYFPNDLGGALARSPEGLYLHSCVPGGETQREWAIRFGVNLLLYATCTDYKSDRAHVETLLRSRRWQ